MEKLKKDARGLPVPYIVLWDGGKPLFTVNDLRLQLNCVLKGICPICGDKLGEVFWFVGGPLSAFHPNGWYNDSACHKECLDYALVVCPYLSMPKYLHRIDAAAASLEAKAHLLLDPTMLPDRPEIFVAVGATQQAIKPNISDEQGFLGLLIRPLKPWTAVEFWKHGERIPSDEGYKVVTRSLEASPR